MAIDDMKFNHLIAQIDLLLESIQITNKILGLLAVKDLKMKKDQSASLLRCGFRPTDVADILGIPVGSVTKARSREKGTTKQ